MPQVSTYAILSQGANRCRDCFARPLRSSLNGGYRGLPHGHGVWAGCQRPGPAAVRRVFEVKRRPLTMPVPLLVADLAMLRSVVEGLPEVALALAERFLPGPLTLVLPRAPGRPRDRHGGRSVGRRQDSGPPSAGEAGGRDRSSAGGDPAPTGRASPVPPPPMRYGLNWAPRSIGWWTGIAPAGSNRRSSTSLKLRRESSGRGRFPRKLWKRSWPLWGDQRSAINCQVTA